MPEGDTLHRTARTLRALLAGKTILRLSSELEAIDDARLAGRRILDVEARGKNLLVHLEGDRVLYTHMRMKGSWHVYRSGERWRKPAHRARLVVETADVVAVCFSAPVVEVLSEAQVARHPTLGTLGPDVLSDSFHIPDVRSRMRELSALPIGEALLRQDVVAGIGNVYKSEVLFVARIHPATAVRDLADEEIDRILLTASDLMKRNLDGFSRVTTPRRAGRRHWVYGLQGRPCLVCGAAIRMRRQGAAGRSTYWCPECQPERG